ncbi:Gag-Pol polyprotein [Taenia solium]|eukprot:TsM_001243300 transcript=TsM_001243300 gene=TsM_001243300
MLETYQTCITCSSFKKPHSTAIAPLQLMPTGFSGERAGIGKRGNRYIPVIVEYFMKVAKAEPMKSHDAETVASTFNRWICQYRVPKSVRSDQGPNFEFRLFIELCNIFGIAKTRTTPGHPQGNGQMLTGHKTRLPLEISLPIKEETTDNALDYILRLEEKKYHDKHSRPKICYEGDLFQIYRQISPYGMYRKFYDPWSRDPFHVVKVLSPTNYLVRNEELCTRPITVHCNEIRPYKGAPPVHYKDEVDILVEERKPPDGKTNGNQRE